MKAHLNEKFSIQPEIKEYTHKPWITKQRTTNVTPFVADFDRKFNKAASNITNETDSKHLN